MNKLLLDGFFSKCMLNKEIEGINIIATDDGIRSTFAKIDKSVIGFVSCSGIQLEKGEYETAQSKSDKTNITGSIKFFKNNLASFVQYKTTDDISWVINNHRQLVAEILEYYGNKEKTSLATIKSRFNAMTRILRKAYETKKYELYEKYSSLVIFLSRQFEADEFDNELSEEELKKFVPFNVVLDKQKEVHFSQLR